MAKIVLETHIPLTEVQAALKNVHRLITINRRRDAIGLAVLCSARQTLCLAETQLLAFKRRDENRRAVQGESVQEGRTEIV